MNHRLTTKHFAKKNTNNNETKNFNTLLQSTNSYLHTYKLYAYAKLSHNHDIIKFNTYIDSKCPFHKLQIKFTSTIKLKMTSISSKPKVFSTTPATFSPLKTITSLLVPHRRKQAKFHPLAIPRNFCCSSPTNFLPLYCALISSASLNNKT